MMYSRERRRRRRSSIVENCWCFGCGDLKEDGTDLVSALKSCGVEEVRAALVEVGFDLDAFDSR